MGDQMATTSEDLAAAMAAGQDTDVAALSARLSADYDLIGPEKYFAAVNKLAEVAVDQELASMRTARRNGTTEPAGVPHSSQSPQPRVGAALRRIAQRVTKGAGRR